ncbi:MAG: hypothetical protein AAFX44_10160 [Pseudomonadota bacterium]
MNTKIRRVIVTWLVVYPMVTLLLAIMESFTTAWPIPLRTLLLSVVMVPLLVLWAMPYATTRLKRFLSPPSSPAKRTLGLQDQVKLGS